jgi:hypothetical protein
MHVNSTIVNLKLIEMMLDYNPLLMPENSCWIIISSIFYRLMGIIDKFINPSVTSASRRNNIQRDYIYNTRSYFEEKRNYLKKGLTFLNFLK